MERFAFLNLQALKVNAMLAVELEIFLGEIFTNHAHKFHRAKEACSHRGMTGGTAEQSRIFCIGCFDGVKGGGTNNEYAHGEFKWQSLDRGWQFQARAR